MEDLNYLTVMFVILKLTDVIDWDWIWVLAPTWVSVLVLMIYLSYIYFKSENTK